ncbi:MAG: ABC transporter permease, partial [Desulfovibrionaceae bacterium]|nr:ABC transporter permease [Desulfovibrionaceae bacterium]
ILFLRTVIGTQKKYVVDANKETLELFETISSKNIEVYDKHTYIPFVLSVLSALGKWLEDKVYFYGRMCGFFGYLLSQLTASILSPRLFHITPIVYQMEHMGIRAIPIISLLSFLIGMVLAYMSAEPFRRFGATLYVINLLEITVLRELGVLLTAIIMAGRTGAACTAEIGSMVNNEEVASMQILGLNVMEYLVIPRVVALSIMLPVVTVIADACALLGGMFAAWFTLDIVPQTFWSIFKDVTQVRTLYLGLFKAPVFAFIISGVGCFYGLQSRGSADDIGKLTTDSVVQSLFLVIVFDALFAVLYSKLGL